MAKYIAAFLAANLPAAQAAPPTINELPLPNHLTLPYYQSSAPNPQTILIVIQGYVRDANRTFDAAAQAAANAGLANQTLIIAPIFEVPPANAAKCSFPGVPPPAATDALWSCGDWSAGARASNGGVTSFTAMDQLIAALATQYPAAHTITLAGFSAGGQYVQRYIGFANPPPHVTMRYVVADPSSWLYFDPIRPLPAASACGNFNDWKFGTQNLPASLGRTAAAARATYAAASIHYLEGARDTGSGPGTAYHLLAKDCAAETQGKYRLDRGENYAAYDKSLLAHGAHTLTIVPGCAHSVTCVFPSSAALPALFGKS